MNVLIILSTMRDKQDIINQLGSYWNRYDNCRVVVARDGLSVYNDLDISMKPCSIRLATMDTCNAMIGTEWDLLYVHDRLDLERIPESGLHYIARSASVRGTAEYILSRLGIRKDYKNSKGEPHINMAYRKVIFSGRATTIIWRDGSKTTVKCSKDEPFDKEKGILMCFYKKYVGETKYVTKMAKRAEDYRFNHI